MSAKQPTFSEFQERQFKRTMTAMNMAKAFISRCEDALAEMKTRDTASGLPSIHFASAKRLSMELTRALAQFRKSPYHKSPNE